MKGGIQEVCPMRWIHDESEWMPFLGSGNGMLSLLSAGVRNSPKEEDPDTGKRVSSPLGGETETKGEGPGGACSPERSG